MMAWLALAVSAVGSPEAFFVRDEGLVGVRGEAVRTVAVGGKPGAAVADGGKRTDADGHGRAPAGVARVEAFWGGLADRRLVVTLEPVAPATAPDGSPVAGGAIVAEYQIPPDAWYFGENGCRTMPYAVLLEAALQPCGWFASYKGSVLTAAEELYFRNLDGTATQYGEVLPDGGLLRTHVTNTSLARLGAMTIESPVWMPTGSMFSMLQMVMAVSLASRMTSYSISL